VLLIYFIHLEHVSWRIKKISLDLIDHYTKRIEPNRYKAMLVATSREAAVAYKRELDRLNAPKSKIIMTPIWEKKEKMGAEYIIHKTMSTFVNNDPPLKQNNVYHQQQQQGYFLL
jgi:type I site-specific restriction-modification system R (restriction) subunit